MQGWRPREPRTNVIIAVRLRTDEGWFDATVRNVSARGMRLHSLQPLRRNQFVEIARGKTRVAGRIVWSDGAGCGLHTQDRLDLAGLLAGPGASQSGNAGERRAAARAAVLPAPLRPLEQRAETARLAGHAFERLMVLIVGAAISAFAAGAAYDALAAPLHQVEAALDAAPGGGGCAGPSTSSG